MKKTMKRYVGLLMAALMLCSSFSAYAAEPEKEEPVSETFVDFLTPFYEGDDEAREVYEATPIEGEGNVAEAFYQETKELYQAGDWKAIHDVFDEKLSGMSKSEVTYEKVARSSDIAKNESRTFLHSLKGVGGSEGYQNYGRDMTYTLVGTIHYNPNTGIISAATGPYISTISITPGGENNMYNQFNPSAVVASNGRSATFSASLHVYYSYFIMVDFGTVRDSFTVRP